MDFSGANQGRNAYTKENDENAIWYVRSLVWEPQARSVSEKVLSSQDLVNIVAVALVRSMQTEKNWELRHDQKTQHGKELGSSCFVAVPEEAQGRHARSYLA